MKRKFFVVLFAIISTVCITLGLTACGDTQGSETTTHTHSYGEWVSDNETTHTRECSCGASETQDHTFNGDTCSRCGYKKPLVTHTHNYSNEWTSDENSHWHACTATGGTCDTPKKDIATHSWNEGVITTEATAEHDGVKTYTCTICGKTKPETVTYVPPHNHTYNQTDTDSKHLKSEATCIAAAVYYKSCTCGENGTETFTSGEFNADNHIHTENKEKQDETCGAIGYTAGVYCNDCQKYISGHEEIPATNNHIERYTPNNNGTHKKDCSACGTVLDESATCSGGSATCINKATCEFCGEEYGSLGRHNYQNHICTECRQGEFPALIKSVEGAEIDNFNIYMLVEHTVDRVSFTDKITTTNNDSWALYSDISCNAQYEILSDIAGILQNGDNTYYILVRENGGSGKHVYTVTIYRSFSVSVNYYDGGSIIKTETAYTGYNYEATYAPDITGYTLNGWALQNGTAYSTDKLFAELNLYADKTAIDYNITYHLNGGTNGDNPVSYTIESDTITLANPSKPGYTFSGWYSESEFVNQVTGIAAGGTGERVFYVKWTPSTYSINYYLYGGTNGDNPVSYTIESDTITLASPLARAHYTFDGWYTEAGYINQITEISQGSTGDKEFYAKWTPVPYNITYHLNGGTNGDNPVSYTIEDSFRLADPSKTGYTFNGWYAESEFVNRVNRIEYYSVGDKEFYARWTANQYMIIYEMNGNHGTILDSPRQTVTYDSAFTLHSASADEGYTFAGYTYNGQPFESGTYKIAGNITIYANWAPISYTITYCVTDSFGKVVSVTDYPTTFTTAELPFALTDFQSDDPAFEALGWYGHYNAWLNAEPNVQKITAIGNVTLYGYLESRSTQGLQYEASGNGWNVTDYTGEETSVVIYPTHLGLPIQDINAVSLPANVTVYMNDSTRFESFLANSTITVMGKFVAEWAFQNAPKTVTVNLCDTVTEIRSYAFYNSQAKIDYQGTLSAWCAVSGQIYIPLPKNCLYINGTPISALNHLIIPNDVKAIAPYAFYNWGCFRLVSVPESVIYIGEHAFDGADYKDSDNNSEYVPLIIDYTHSTVAEFKKIEGYANLWTGYRELHTKDFTGCNRYTLTVTADDDFSQYSENINITSVEFKGEVTRINGFANCPSLESITIGDEENGSQVTNILFKAFAGCTNLKEVIIYGSSYLYISSDAFLNCNFKLVYKGSLANWCSIRGAEHLWSASSEIEFKKFSLSGSLDFENVGTVQNGAFVNCTFDTIEFSAPTTIESGAFFNCTFDTIEFSAPTTIESGAFVNCTFDTIKLAADYLALDPSYIQTMLNLSFQHFYVGSYEVKKQNNVVSLIIPDTETSFGNITFNTNNYNNWFSAVTMPAELGRDSSSGLKMLTINLTVTGKTIPDNAFDGWNFKSLTISDSVTTIGNYAFSNCGIQTLTIPNSVTTIGGDAFSNCISLTHLSAPITSGTVSFISNTSSLRNLTVTGTSVSSDSYHYLHHSGITSLSLSDTVTSVTAGTFRGLSGLTELTLGAYIWLNTLFGENMPTGLNRITVNSGDIPDRAYENMTSLTQFIMGDGITSIGDYAFAGSSIAEIILPDSVTSIGNHVFEGCTSLTQFIMGDGITSIGKYAFEGCTNLQYNGNQNKYLGSSSNPLMYLAIYNGGQITSTTKFIAADAFKSFSSSGFTNINVASSYFYYDSTNGALYSADRTVLIKYASGKTNTTFAIPTTVTKIADYAFYGAKYLQTVSSQQFTISNVVSVGDHAFDGCTALRTVSVLNSQATTNKLESIGDYAFKDCPLSGLTTVFIATGVNYIGKGAFAGASFGNAAFKNTSGWYVASNADFSDEQTVNEPLSSTSNSATLLKTTYVDYYWIHK